MRGPRIDRGRDHLAELARIVGDPRQDRGHQDVTRDDGLVQRPNGLDPIARRQIHDILLALKRDGRTVLISSHYLDEIEALADRVIILAAGQIVADGTPLDLLARAAGASTLWLDVSGAIDPSRLVPQATFEGRDGSLFRYRTTDPTAAIVGLADSLRGSGARLDDLRLKRPSLEDVYLQLVGAA